MSVYRELAWQGLWKNNPALVQLLGLCPLLGVSNSVVNALGLAAATLVVLTGSNLVVSLIRNHISDTIRLPVFVMVIASLTTCVELLMQAYAYSLYQVLGIFIPLIVTNCIILGRAEAYASRNPLPRALADGFLMALGFGLVLVLVGCVREMLGAGTLFSRMDLLLGPSASQMEIRLAELPSGIIFFALPPGAFLVVGLLIALKNSIDARIEAARKARAAPVQTGSKRVRVTGKIS
jgi:electron transport complex protein RnfE